MGDSLADGLVDADGDVLAEGETLALVLTDGDTLLDGLTEAEALTDGLTLAEGETDVLGETEALALTLGLTEAEGLVEADGLTLALALPDGETLALGERDAEGETEAEADTPPPTDFLNVSTRPYISSPVSVTENVHSTVPVVVSTFLATEAMHRAGLFTASPNVTSAKPLLYVRDPSTVCATSAPNAAKASSSFCVVVAVVPVLWAVTTVLIFVSSSALLSGVSEVKGPSYSVIVPRRFPVE